MAEAYFFNNLQKSSYLSKIVDIVVGTDLEERLTRENGVKYCLERFNYESD